MLVFALIPAISFAQRDAVPYQAIQTKTDLPARQKTDETEILFPGNWLRIDSVIIYTVIDNGGFVAGTNVYGDLAKAQRFTVDKPGMIVGAGFWIGVRDGEEGTLAFNIWSFNGSPGEVLASRVIPANQIGASLLYSQAFYVAFDEPVPVDGDFVVGFDMADIGQTQIALVSSWDGEAGELGLSWEKWSDSKWYTFSDPDGWDMDIDLAIFPVIMWDGDDPNIPELQVTAVVNRHVSCFGGGDAQATASATGGVEPYTWLWSDGQTSRTASGLSAGTYQVTVTDSEGRTATTNVSITQPDQLTVTATGTNNTIHGGSDGAATAHVSGGTTPYTYLWNDSAAQSSQTANNLMAGTYTVSVTDANGCTANTTITLTQPGPAVPELSVTASVNSHVSCFGGSNGQATATATGGVGPYTWLWSDGQQTDVVYNLVAGTHQVTLTDDLGNTAQAKVTITEPSPLEVVLTTTNPTTYDGRNGTAVASVSGGTSPYTYLWTDPREQQTQTITGLAAGTYMLAVTDSNDCTAIAMARLTSPDPFPNITYDALAIRFTSGAGEIIPMDQIRIMQFDFSTPVDATSVPVSTMMAMSNYPNPFSGSTTIEFELDRPGHVDIMIYDLTGRSIRRLICQDCAAGSNRLEWDGRDDGGAQLHSGVYVLRMLANDQIYNHRLLLVR